MWGGGGGRKLAHSHAGHSQYKVITKILSTTIVKSFTKLRTNRIFVDNSNALVQLFATMLSEFLHMESTQIEGLLKICYMMVVVKFSNIILNS